MKEGEANSFVVCKGKTRQTKSEYENTRVNLLQSFLVVAQLLESFVEDSDLF